MIVVSEPEEFRSLCQSARQKGVAGPTAALGLVPTMGALHEGHLALMRKARQACEFLAVSIFVNPTQFGPSEDLARYPRDLDADLKQCRAVGVDAVFTPEARDMYAPGEQTRVDVGSLADVLCGASRPGHFRGVCTVVSKLFNLAGPCVAVFGRKDYQQLKIIERMVADLFIPVRVIDHPIVREADGLAMSSRNRYLSVSERQRALAIVHGLNRAVRLFADGERQLERLLSSCREPIIATGLNPDYVSLVDPEELSLPQTPEVAEQALLAVAAFVGKTRLIDNLVLGRDGPVEVKS